MSTENEQKLVDIAFELALTMHEHPWFIGKTKEQVANWVAERLAGCGFETEPCGSSWGVLK